MPFPSRLTSNAGNEIGTTKKAPKIYNVTVPATDVPLSFIFHSDLRELHPGNRASRFPAVADQLPCGSFPRQHPAERRENDQRAAEGTASEHNQVFPSGTAKQTRRPLLDVARIIANVLSRRIRYQTTSSSRRRSRRDRSRSCCSPCASSTPSFKNAGSLARLAGIISTSSTRPT